MVDEGFVVRIPDSLPLESAPEVEVIDADQIDDAYRRLLAGDVRFRFVIDNSTLTMNEPDKRNPLSYS